MDDSLKKYMDGQFGKHRGGLWRSEREWYVYSADKNPMGAVKEYADLVKEKRRGLYNKDGYTKTRLGRWIGDIPTSIAFSNPELITDPEAAKRFFKEFPEFSSKG